MAYRDWQAPLNKFGSKQAPVEVCCRVIRDNDRDNAILIEDGTMTENIDKETGEITEKPKQFWIPRSQIKKIEPAADGNGSIVTMTDWIAKKAGLI
jgi:hypothetical protein